MGEAHTPPPHAQFWIGCAICRKTCWHPRWIIEDYQDDPQSRVLAAREVCVQCRIPRREAERHG